MKHSSTVFFAILSFHVNPPKFDVAESVVISSFHETRAQLNSKPQDRPLFPEFVPRPGIIDEPYGVELHNRFRKSLFRATRRAGLA